MSKKKRVRTPTPKDDTLIVAWGRADQFSSPSLVYVYPNRDIKCDTRVVMEALEGPRYGYTFEDFGTPKQQPSLIAELEARGYDITTLRLTIQKKKEEPENSPAP